MSLRRILMISGNESITTPAETASTCGEDHRESLLGLSRALARQDFVVDIVGPQGVEQPAVEAIDDGVQIFHVATHGDDRICAGHTQHEPLMAVLNHPHLRHQRYELIHSHSWNAGLVASALSRAWKTPHVHTPHTLGALLHQQVSLTNGDTHQLTEVGHRLRHERMIFHQADVVISNSAMQTRCLMESDEYNVPVEKIAEIPPGFDDEVFFRPHPGQRTVTKELLGWSAPTVLAAGGTPFSVGYERLIRVFPVVLRRISTAQLILMIASPHPTPEERQRLTELKMLAGELGIGSRTHIVLVPPRAGIADYYRSADVFVDCSDDESMNMAAIEAIACGTPTIVTAAEQRYQELNWGYDALRCDARQAASFAESLTTVLQDHTLRQRLATRGAAKVRDSYSWDQVAQQWCQRCLEQPAVTAADFSPHFVEEASFCRRGC